MTVRDVNILPCRSYRVKILDPNSLVRTYAFLCSTVRPTCAEQQQWTYGSGRGEQVNVSCQVHAHPDATSFRWAFNTSAEVLNIPSNRTRVLRNRSNVTYTPMTHHDFGTLLCWGVNEVGEQVQPCVFLIVPAGGLVFSCLWVSYVKSQL